MAGECLEIGDVVKDSPTGPGTIVIFVNGNEVYKNVSATALEIEEIVAPWRSAVLDLIDECPGLTMEQDHWLSRRVKELDFASTPQPSQPHAVNQADRPLIVRLAEDFAEDCVTAGYVTTKAASYGRLMYEALSLQAQAGTVPLTDEQIVGVMHSIPINAAPSHLFAFARAIVQAHGIGIKKGDGHA